MLPGEMLKYGKINEKSGGADVVPVSMVASQVVKARSGRFVFQVAGAATLVVASSTTIYGVLNTHEHTPAVGDVIGCDISKDAIGKVKLCLMDWSGVTVGGYVSGQSEMDPMVETLSPFFGQPQGILSLTYQIHGINCQIVMLVGRY